MGWAKVAMLGGAAIAAGVVGYLAYRYVSKPAEKEDNDNDDGISSADGPTKTKMANKPAYCGFKKGFLL